VCKGKQYDAMANAIGLAEGGGGLVIIDHLFAPSTIRHLDDCERREREARYVCRCANLGGDTKSIAEEILMYMSAEESRIWPTCPSKTKTKTLSRRYRRRGSTAIMSRLCLIQLVCLLVVCVSG
jgi:hypothetical protein